MKNFNIYDPMKRGQGLVLDGQTLAHVEVLQNNEGTDEGSLLKILGRCVTPFGKLLSRHWSSISLIIFSCNQESGFSVSGCVCPFERSLP